MNTWERDSKDERTCGTAACAVGSAMFWWPLRLLGLKTEGDIESGFLPRYKQWDNWYAVKHFFGLSMADSEYLFDNGHYPFADPTADQVADRILNYINGNKEPQYA